MELVKSLPVDDIPVLLGVTSDKGEKGLVGFIIDPLDGSAIIRVNCDEAATAKFVFGFTEPGDDSYYPDDDEIAFRVEIDKMLKQSFPDGYSLEWVGWWRDDPRTVKLCGWLDGTKPQLDDYFDYEVNERSIRPNVEAAKKSNYEPNEKLWMGDKKREFYLGMVSALRVVTGMIQNSKTQKELSERINRLNMDAMILSDRKKAKLIL